MDEATKQRLIAAAKNLAPLPRLDEMKAHAVACARRAYKDEQLAVIWAEQLRHTYAQVQEQSFPDLDAENGDLLPVDTSMDPAATEYEYFRIDHQGYADFIDDDGNLMPSNTSMEAHRYTGGHHEMGHEYTVNFFELERAAKAKTPSISIVAVKEAASKRYHAELTNWVWLFGEPSKNLPGLLTHPNIPVSLAPLNAGSTSRLLENKTNSEIAADFALLINALPLNTQRRYHAATVYLSLGMYHVLKDRKVSTGDSSFASVMDWMIDRYKGDDSGQGKVSFKILNPCSAEWRVDPRTGTDTSGISGEFMFAVAGGLSKEDAHFIRSRPYTKLPPQEKDFNTRHVSHSKIGGVVNRVPLAFHRLDYGTV